MKMLTVITIMFSLFTVAAFAEETSDKNPKFKGFYLVGNQKVAMDKAEAAIMAAIKGEEVYKCQTVEASLNKNQTAISLKNVKRKK